MAVRSRRFFGPYRPLAASTFEPVYTVPDGRTARFSNLLALNFTSGPLIMAFLLGAPGSQFSFWRELVPSNSTMEPRGEQVLNPGDTLWVFIDGSRDGTFSGFGSLLLGPPT